MTNFACHTAADDRRAQYDHATTHCPHCYDHHVSPYTGECPGLVCNTCADMQATLAAWKRGHACEACEAKNAKIATLTAEIARYRLPRECGTCGAVQHGGQVLCAECAEVLIRERDALKDVAYVIPPSPEDPQGDTYQDAHRNAAAERDALQKKCDDYGSILSQWGNIDKAAAIAERDALAARVRDLEDKHNRTFICLWCGAELDTGCTPQEAQENPEKVGELIRRCREHDEHCKDNPLAARLTTACHDWAKDDTAIRNALRPILGAIVDGDANWVPPLVDLVERVVANGRELEEAAANDLAWRAAVLTETCPTDEVHCGCVAILRQRIADLEHDLHLAEQGHANAH